MNIVQVFKSLFKVSFDDSPWDGSASNWDSPEAYCSDCLIDLNEAGQSKTKDKCKLPYRKPGSSAVNKGALRAIASGARGLAATDAPPAAKQAAAKKVAGWWKSAFGTDVPPSIARMAGSGSKEVNEILVTKDSNGQWWFFGIYSNKFKDLDGEILSEDSHKEYIQWLKESGFKPVITAYHYPRAKDPAFWTKVFNAFEDNVPALQKIVDAFYRPIAFAKVERVVYSNGFTAVVAKFLPGKEKIAERLSKAKNFGMSHGFINKESDANIFNKYRTFEMSILRSVRAANMFTRSGALLQKGLGMAGQNDEQKGLSAEDRAAIAEIFGDEVLSKFEKDTATAEDILSGLLAYKESVDEKAKKPANDDGDGGDSEDMPMDSEDMPMKPKKNKKEATEDEEKQEEIPANLTVESVAKSTLETFEQLQTVLAEMQKRQETAEAKIASLEKELSDSKAKVEEMKKSDDEKIASNWLPPINWRAGYSASQAKDNIVDDKEKEQLTKNAPEDTQPQPKNSVMGYALAPLFTNGLRG